MQQVTYVLSATPSLGRGVSGGWARWPIAHPDLGRLQGAAGLLRRAALFLAHPVF